MNPWIIAVRPKKKTRLQSIQETPMIKDLPKNNRICMIAKRQDKKDGKKNIFIFSHPSYPAALRSCISCYFLGDNILDLARGNL